MLQTTVLAPDETSVERREPSGAERRRYDRHELSIRVLMRQTLHATSGQTVNVSRGGALVRTAGPLRIGGLYECTLQVPDAIFRRAGRVLRELPGYIYAVEFETLIPEPTLYAE
jgi:hypothetical protein